MRSILRLLALTALAWTAPVGAQQVPAFGLRAATPPAWRASASVGLAGPWLDTIASASAEVPVSGAFGLGARLAYIADGGAGPDDGGSMTGGLAELQLSATRRTRWLELRAIGGLGFSALFYDDGEASCDPQVDECRAVTSFVGVPAHAFGGVGVDVYPHAAVGMGVEGRLAAMRGPANVSSVEIGLRVRVGD